MSRTHWIGLDLGGTKLLGGLFDADFTLLKRHKQATAVKDGPQAVFGQIVAAVDALLAEAGVPRAALAGVGLGIPGQVDPRTNRVRYAPNLDWHDLDLRTALPGDWSELALTVENDVKVGTYGEFAHGAAKGTRHVLGVFVGTGVGGGLILNGELYHGFNFNAGEIGHTVLHWRKGTTLEQIAGRRWIMERAAAELKDAPKKVRKGWKAIDPAAMKSSQLAALYEDDDPLAMQLVEDAARALGASLGSLVNLLSPEVIVIGGGVAGALGPSFLERAWELAQRYALPGAANGVRCVPAALGDDSGIYGAAALAKLRAGTAPPVGGDGQAGQPAATLREGEAPAEPKTPTPGGR